MAERVFGRQLGQAGSTIADQSLSAYQRMALHRRHLEEIQEWRNDLLNQLSFARRPYAISTPQQVAQLERLILQLESDRRKEELAYWEDVAELRKEQLESRFAYLGLKDRFDLLGALEAFNA